MRKINSKPSDEAAQKEFIESAKHTSEELIREVVALQEKVASLEKQLKAVVDERDNYRYECNSAHSRLINSAGQITNIFTYLPSIPRDASLEEVRRCFEKLIDSTLEQIMNLIRCENCAESDKLFPELCKRCHRRDQWRPKPRS